MSGSSAGVPYSAQAIASSPSSPSRTTSAAWAMPSSTMHFLKARLPSYPGTWSARSGWNLTHQHPPKMPLCRSTSAAKRFHVSGASGLIVVEPGSWVAMTPTVPRPATWKPIPSGALSGNGGGLLMRVRECDEGVGVARGSSDPDGYTGIAQHHPGVVVDQFAGEVERWCGVVIPLVLTVVTDPRIVLLQALDAQ